MLAELWSASSWSNRWPLRARQASSCLSALPCRFSLDVKAALSFVPSPGGPEALPSGGSVPLRPGQARPATLSPADSALTSSEVLGPANSWVLNSQNILPTRGGIYLLQGLPPGGGAHQTSHPPGDPGVHLAAFTFENQYALLPFAPRLGSYPLRPQRGTSAESGRAVLTTRPGGARARSGTTACKPFRRSC